MANSILQGNMPFDRSIYSKADVDKIVEEHSHYIVSPAANTYIRPMDNGTGVIDRTIEVNKYLSMTCSSNYRVVIKAPEEGEEIWHWIALDPPEGQENYVLDFVGPFTSSIGDEVYVPSTSPVFDGFDPEAFYATLWAHVEGEGDEAVWKIQYKNFPQWFTFSDRDGSFIGHDVVVASGSVDGTYYNDVAPTDVISDSRILATMDDIGAISASEITADRPISVSAPIGAVNITHDESGVTAGDYGVNESRRLAPGGSFNVPSHSVDATGHITSDEDVELFLPNGKLSFGDKEFDGSNDVYLDATDILMGDESNDTVANVIHGIQEEIGGGGGGSITERLDKLDAEVADLSNDLVDLSNDIDSRLDDLSNDLATHEHSYIVNGSTKVQANDDGTASIVAPEGQKRTIATLDDLDRLEDSIQSEMDDLSNDIGGMVDARISDVEGKIADLSNDLGTRMDGIDACIDDLSNDIVEVVDGRIAEVEGRIDDLSNDVYSAIDDLSNDFNSRLDDLSNDVSLRAMDDNVVHKTGPLVEGQTIVSEVSIPEEDSWSESSPLSIKFMSGDQDCGSVMTGWYEQRNSPPVSPSREREAFIGVSDGINNNSVYLNAGTRVDGVRKQYASLSWYVKERSFIFELPTRSGTIALQETIPSANYATDAVYGIAKLSDATDSTSDAASGKTAATPLAVKTALDSASNALSSAVSSLQTEIGSKADANHTHSSLSSDDGNSVMSILDSGNGRIQSTRKIAGDFSLECVEDFTISFDYKYNVYLPKFNGTTGMTISLKGPYPLDANTDVYVTTEYQGTPTAASFAEYGDFVGWYVLVYRTESTYLTDLASCRYMARHTGNNHPADEPIYNRTGVYDSQVIPLTANSSVVSVGGHVMDLHQTVDTSTSDRIIATTDQIPVVPTSFDRIVSPDGNTTVAASNNKVATITYPTDTTTSVFFPEGFSITSSGTTYSAPVGGETITFKGPYRMTDSSGYSGEYIWYPTNLPNDPQEEIDPSSYNPWRWFMFGSSSSTATYLLWGGNFGFSITAWGSEHPTLTVDQSSTTSGDPPAMTRSGSDFVTRNLAFSDHTHASIVSGDTTVSAVNGGTATITKTVPPTYGNMVVTFPADYSITDGSVTYTGPGTVEFEGPYYNESLNYTFWYPTDLQDDPGTSFDPSNYHVWCLYANGNNDVPSNLMYETGSHYYISEWNSSSPKLTLGYGTVSGSKPLTSRSSSPNPPVTKMIATTDGVVTSVNTRRGNVSLDATNLYMDSTQTQSIAQAIASIPGGGIQSVNGDTGPDVLLDATNLYMDSNDQVTIAEAIDDAHLSPLYSDNRENSIVVTDSGYAELHALRMDGVSLLLHAGYSVSYEGVSYSAQSDEMIGMEGVHVRTIDGITYYFWLPTTVQDPSNFNPFDGSSESVWYFWKQVDPGSPDADTAVPEFLSYANGPQYTVDGWYTDHTELSLVSGTESGDPPETMYSKSAVQYKMLSSEDLSYDTPRMDGVPSPGQGEYAARWDHVHPSDSRKVDQGVNDSMFIQPDGAVQVIPAVYLYSTDNGIDANGDNIVTYIQAGSDNGGVFCKLIANESLESDSATVSGSMQLLYRVPVPGGTMYDTAVLFSADANFTRSSATSRSISISNVVTSGHDANGTEFSTTQTYRYIMNGSASIIDYTSTGGSFVINCGPLTWVSGGSNPNTTISIPSIKTLASTKYVDDAIAGISGTVVSVNGESGVVVLDADDIMMGYDSNDITIAEAIGGLDDRIGDIDSVLDAINGEVI